MRDAVKSYLALASGLTEVTRQRAVGAANALVAQGAATAGQVTELADDLLQQSKQNREAVTALVRYEVEKTLGRVGLAPADEVERLTTRIKALEGELADLKVGPAKAPAAKAPAAKAPAAKAPAAKAPAKKAAAKKAPATKAAATKAAR